MTYQVFKKELPCHLKGKCLLSYRKREQRHFKGLGYEPHLVETLEKDLLVKNPDVKWNHIAGQTS